MPGYTQLDVDVLDARTKTHKNGEQTHVVVLDTGGGYVALAVDEVDDHGEHDKACVIATTATEEEAIARAEAWAAENPKGVAPGKLGGLLG